MGHGHGHGRAYIYIHVEPHFFPRLAVSCTVALSTANQASLSAGLTCFQKVNQPFRLPQLPPVTEPLVPPRKRDVLQTQESATTQFDPFDQLFILLHISLIPKFNLHPPGFRYSLTRYPWLSLARHTHAFVSILSTLDSPFHIEFQRHTAEAFQTPTSPYDTIYIQLQTASPRAHKFPLN